MSISFPTTNLFDMVSTVLDSFNSTVDLDPCYPYPRLSEIANDCSIKVFEYRLCSFRVIKQSSVYKCMGFSYPNNSLI